MRKVPTKTGCARRLTATIALGLMAGMGTLLTSLYLVPELSGAVGGLAAAAVFLVWRRRRLAGAPVRALLPYAFLLALLAAAAVAGVAADQALGGGMPAAPPA